MIGAMCLADAGVLETLKTESATICPRQPLEIIVLFMPIEKGIDDYQGRRRGCRDAKAGLRKTTLMS